MDKDDPCFYATLHMADGTLKQWFALAKHAAPYLDLEQMLVGCVGKTPT